MMDVDSITWCLATLFLGNCVSTWMVYAVLSLVGEAGASCSAHACDEGFVANLGVSSPQRLTVMRAQIA